MSKKPNHSGLRLRGKIWHIDKQYRGQHISGSTKTGVLSDAVEILNKRMEAVRLAELYGYRREYLFGEAAAEYLRVKRKKSIALDIYHLQRVMPFISETPIDKVYDKTLEPFIEFRIEEGVKPKTINEALGIVSAILRLCARSWRDENGNPWLRQEPPLIAKVPVGDTAAKPYPLSRSEQRELFSRLSDDLARICLYKVNTGIREQELCGLRWEWELSVMGTDHTVFFIPANRIKNTEERLVIHNDIAQTIINKQRENGSELVFPSPVTGDAYYQLNNTGWQKAWRDAGLPVGSKFLKGVHNLKHTFGKRLRAAGVSEENRRTLLGHKNGSITTDYSAPEILELIRLSDKVRDERVEAVLTGVNQSKTDKTPTVLKMVSSY